MSPRIVFEQELEQLREKLALMADCAQNSCLALISALKENDCGRLEQLLDEDRRMLEMQRGIETACLALMTRQQPVAKDLRLVSAALKVVTDIERIGAHVSEMAELFLRREEPVFAYEDGCDSMLLSMLEEAFRMFAEAVEAFVEGDEEAARTVIGSDNVVDEYFNRVKKNMLEAIREQTMDADRVVDNLMIAKYLEKIGDHAVLISSWAVFEVTGEVK